MAPNEGTKQEYIEKYLLAIFFSKTNCPVKDGIVLIVIPGCWLGPPWGWGDITKPNDKISRKNLLKLCFSQKRFGHKISRLFGGIFW